MSERLLERSTAFLLAFDPETLELVVLTRYHSVSAAIPAMIRESDLGKLATILEAESEATLRATGDIEGIGR